jgi:ATP-binding cassette subfamily C (CFTR/MRP) protein 1
MILVCGASNTWAAKMTSEKQKIWIGAVQSRISSVASMLGSIKSVKMMGLAGVLSQNIRGQQEKEMNSAMVYRWMVLLTNTTGHVPQIFAPVLTFVAFEVRARIQGSESLFY